MKTLNENDYTWLGLCQKQHCHARTDIDTPPSFDRLLQTVGLSKKKWLRMSSVLCCEMSRWVQDRCGVKKGRLGYDSWWMLGCFCLRVCTRNNTRQPVRRQKTDSIQRVERIGCCTRGWIWSDGSSLHWKNKEAMTLMMLSLTLWISGFVSDKLSYYNILYLSPRTL